MLTDRDQNDVSACTSCTWIMIDQILELELHITCKVLAQDVSRRLQASVMPFESRIGMSTKDGFDSIDSYLNPTDF